MAAPSVDELIDSGLSELHAGRAAEAEAAFRQILSRSPDDAEALGLLGVALFQQDRNAEARQVLERALELDDSIADVHYNFGEALGGVTSKEAGASYLRCTELDPNHPLAWRRLAEWRLRQGDHPGAVIAATRACRLAPKDGSLALWTGRLMLGGQYKKEAVVVLRTAAELLPKDLDLHVLLARQYSELKDSEGMLWAVEGALRISPDDRRILLERLQHLYTLEKLAKARELGTEFVKRFPDDGDGHFILGSILMREKDMGAAAFAIARSIELRPEEASGFGRLGEIFLAMGRPNDAEEQLNEAIRLDPKLVPARVHLSILLEKNPGKREEAIAEARKAVELDPNDVEALNWLGMMLVRCGRHTEAGESFRKSLEISPEGVNALVGYGTLLAGQARIHEGWEKMAQAMRIAPDDPFPPMSAVFIGNGHPDISADELFALHQKWARLWHKREPAPFTSWDNDRDPDRKVVVGYLSPDLRGHSVSFFLEPLLRAHDRSKFTIVIMDNTQIADLVTQRMLGLVDHWYRVVGASEQRIVEIVQEKKIDILVDLTGHTSENKIGVFARKPAPVQVTYLGYPNTTGLAEVDYRFTDELCDPVGASEAYHSEELIRLPGGFLCFRGADLAIDVGPLPAGETGAITFCSFNAVHKINGKIIALWSRVLKAVPGSTMLFKAAGMSDPETRQHMIEHFTANGIGAERLEFVERTISYKEHLDIYNRCDIGLDTFPYHGTTTTCEALWMGVPVVSLTGDRHAARVGLSILTRIGLPELAPETPDEFVEAAVSLATDRKRLAALRAGMRDRMLKSRLMDAKAQATEIETAYRQMWRKWCGSQK
jgi:predicted O-linked N-acetylglucosamine transferase (SPINDLY family)